MSNSVIVRPLHLGAHIAIQAANSSNWLSPGRPLEQTKGNFTQGKAAEFTFWEFCRSNGIAHLDTDGWRDDGNESAVKVDGIIADGSQANELADPEFLAWLCSQRRGARFAEGFFEGLAAQGRIGVEVKSSRKAYSFIVPIEYGRLTEQRRQKLLSPAEIVKRAAGRPPLMVQAEAVRQPSGAFRVSLSGWILSSDFWQHAALDVRQLTTDQSGEGRIAYILPIAEGNRMRDLPAYVESLSTFASRSAWSA